jgi:hypothetical protein
MTTTLKPRNVGKHPIDIEEALSWAYRKELRSVDRQRRQHAAAEGPRLRPSPLASLVDLGTAVDGGAWEPGFPAGSAHPDAFEIEAAVALLAGIDLPCASAEYASDLLELVSNCDDYWQAALQGLPNLIPTRATLRDRPAVPANPKPQARLAPNGRPSSRIPWTSPAGRFAGWPIFPAHTALWAGRQIPGRSFVSVASTSRGGARSSGSRASSRTCSRSRSSRLALRGGPGQTRSPIRQAGPPTRIRKIGRVPRRQVAGPRAGNCSPAVAAAFCLTYTSKRRVPFDASPPARAVGRFRSSSSMGAVPSAPVLPSTGRRRHPEPADRAACERPCVFGDSPTRPASRLGSAHQQPARPNQRGLAIASPAPLALRI